MASSGDSVSNGDTPEVEQGGGEATASSPVVHRTDLALAFLILSVCGYLYYLSTEFDQVANVLAQNIQPDFFPQMLIWTIAFLTIFIPFEHRYLKGGAAALDKERNVPIKSLAFFTAALLTAVVTAIIWVGTIASMVIVCMAMPVLWGERRVKVIVPYAIIFPILITILFNKVLGVHFEPGLFESIFSIH